MTVTRLRGITWAHRRAIDPLVDSAARFARVHPEIEVDWSARPLSGFEFQPVDELAADYDLIVLDHPFMGEVARLGCLMPLDELIGEGLEKAFVGATLASYRYAGRLWAVPIDAACQVSVWRPDLLADCGEAPPRSWPEMLALGEQIAPRGLRLAIALSGVHSLMTFFSLSANSGRPCGSDPDGPFVEPQTAAAALAAMRRLLMHSPAEALDWNSIAVQDAMAGRDDLVFCPAVYGFATYAEGDNAPPLAYGDFAGLAAPYGAGSTLGGAGLAVSAACQARTDALAYVAYLLEAGTQLRFAAHHGQPARVEAWEDTATDARFGGFYRDTRASIEQAWLRPRYDGYLGFQKEAGTLIERHLRGDGSEGELISALEALYAETSDIPGSGSAQPPG